MCLRGRNAIPTNASRAVCCLSTPAAIATRAVVTPRLAI